MELLVKSTRIKPALREMIDKLLDKDVTLDDIYNCTGSILKVIDNLCKESHYNKAMCMMGISQSLNNIMTKRFHPKIIKSYPTYIRISKIVLKYFRMSVTVLMGCNLELEFDTVNSLNFNLAKIEINYGIMLTSPDVVALFGDRNKSLKVGRQKTLCVVSERPRHEVPTTHKQRIVLTK